MKYIKELSDIYAEVHAPNTTSERVLELSDEVAGIIDDIFEDGYRDGEKDAYYNADIK